MDVWLSSIAIHISMSESTKAFKDWKVQYLYIFRLWVSNLLGEDGFGDQLDYYFKFCMGVEDMCIIWIMWRLYLRTYTSPLALQLAAIGI